MRKSEKNMLRLFADWCIIFHVSHITGYMFNFCYWCLLVTENCLFVWSQCNAVQWLDRLFLSNKQWTITANIFNAVSRSCDGYERNRKGLQSGSDLRRDVQGSGPLQASRQQRYPFKPFIMYFSQVYMRDTLFLTLRKIITISMIIPPSRSICSHCCAIWPWTTLHGVPRGKVVNTQFHIELLFRCIVAGLVGHGCKLLPVIIIIINTQFLRNSNNLMHFLKFVTPLT